MIRLVKDLREAVIEERLGSVGRILAIMSPKGGVGKTTISVMLSLALRGLGKSVGLLDLDLTNPSAHIVLGVDVRSVAPEERKGVVPPEVCGIKFMSIAFYSRDSALPLRGSEISEVIKELLAITIWGNLDYLVIDTPPGISDEALDLLNYFSRALIIAVTTPSILSVKATERLLTMLKDYGADVLGVIENMGGKSEDVVRLCKSLDIRYLGSVPYDPMVDRSVGRPDALLSTRAGAAVKSIAEDLVSS